MGILCQGAGEKRRAATVRYRARLEVLEDRTAPATITLAGAGRFQDGPVTSLVYRGNNNYTALNLRSAIVGADSDSPKVVLDGGEEIESRVVVSNADPRTTFLNLVDPVDLNPNFLSKMRNYRAPGTAAKINLALSALPVFAGVNGSDPKAKLSGRIHIGPEIDYLERAFDAAKYGEFSAEPYLDVTIPSLGDPALAPEGKHVMSVHAQFAPYKLNGDWRARRELDATRESGP